MEDEHFQITGKYLVMMREGNKNQWLKIVSHLLLEEGDDGKAWSRGRSPAPFQYMRKTWVLNFRALPMMDCSKLGQGVRGVERVMDEEVSETRYLESRG